MTQVTYTSHPRITVEHRPDGPVVVHDRRGPAEDVRRNRFKLFMAGLIGIAFLGFLLLLSWRAGDLDGADIRNALLAGAGLVAGVGYLIVVGRGRVEIEAIGNRLQIRARPLDVDNGGSVELNQIDYLQVEKDNEFGRDKYRVQLVSRDGYGLLPSFRALSDINTYDEAVWLAGSIAQQFGLRSLNGIQPAAKFSSEPDVGPTMASDNNNATGELPGSFSAGVSDGKIRVVQMREGPVVSYVPGFHGRGYLVRFSITLFLACGYITTVIVRDLSELGELAMLAMLSIFWVAGLFVLGYAWGHQEIYREGDNLVTHFRLGPFRVNRKRILTSDLDRVAIEVYWDSYHKMHHKMVAHMKKGDDVTMEDPISEANGHALCMALHRQFGVPI